MSRSKAQRDCDTFRGTSREAGVEDLGGNTEGARGMSPPLQDFQLVAPFSTPCRTRAAPSDNLCERSLQRELFAQAALNRYRAKYYRCEHAIEYELSSICIWPVARKIQLAKNGLSPALIPSLVGNLRPTSGILTHSNLSRVAFLRALRCRFIVWGTIPSP